MNKDSLLQFTSKGIFCPRAEIYLDPFVPVKRAAISHAHADHMVYGCRHYLAQTDTKSILKLRLGSHVNCQGLKYGEPLLINGINVSFHPAGHILGSSQIRLEYKGEIWVYSGDYKLEDDGISTPFQSISCHHFITESTFAHPKYSFPKQEDIFTGIQHWYNQNSLEGKSSVIGAYVLGKTQRILHHIKTKNKPIYAHVSVPKINEIYKQAGISLPPVIPIDHKVKPQHLIGHLVIAPMSILKTAWRFRLHKYEMANASGWSLDPNKSNTFPLSDHADWKAILQAIKSSKAEYIYTLHGQKQYLADYLIQQGYSAHAVTWDKH